MYSLIIGLTSFFMKLFYRHQVYGREHILSGAGVLAANHVSFLDPPVLAISCPEEVYFLARATLFRGLFGRFIHSVNARPVHMGGVNLHVWKEVCHLLRSGKKIVLFPEGTRSEDGSLQELKPGLFLLMSQTGSPVQPAYIHGTFSIWGRGRKRPKLFGKTACIWGSPLLWSRYMSLPRREAEEAFRRELRDAIIALRQWYEDGAAGSPP
jgi:1-acyl-sn-glycerol-3-phosphate acyltransferase